jgi:hypothetical protein
MRPQTKKSCCRSLWILLCGSLMVVIMLTSVSYRVRELSTAVASDDVVRRGDALQYQLNEGPCLDAVRCQETVISRNLGEEARWPEWTHVRCRC